MVEPRRRTLVALAASLGVPLLLSGCADATSTSDSPVANVQVHDTDGLHGIRLPRAALVPHVGLRDARGASYDLAARARKPLTLVFFGYTRCPDICQVVMSSIASGLVRLDRAQRSRVGMVFVTTDPARDTPPVLRGYLRRFDPSFEGLTGGLAQVTRLGAALGVPIEQGRRLPSGGYDVEHGTNIVGLTPDRRAPYVWTQGTSPADLAEDVTRILARATKEGS